MRRSNLHITRRQVCAGEKTSFFPPPISLEGSPIDRVCAIPSNRPGKPKPVPRQIAVSGCKSVLLYCGVVEICRVCYSCKERVDFEESWILDMRAAMEKFIFEAGLNGTIE